MSDLTLNVAMNDDGPAQIFVYDFGGGHFSGIDAREFLAELRSRDLGDVDVHINSRGGNPFEAMAIFSLLRDLDAQVTTIVDGVAASSASLIFLAGDKRVMRRGSMLMIHEPSFGADAVEAEGGQAKDLRRLARRLDKLKESVRTMYADHSSLDVDKVASMMSSETWMTADEALTHGFATELAEAEAVAACASLDNFRNVPEAAMSLVRAAPTTTGEQPMPEAKPKAPEQKPEEKKTEPNGDPTHVTMTVAEFEQMRAAAEPKPNPGKKKPEVNPGEEHPSADPVMAERSRVEGIHAVCDIAGIDATRTKEFVDGGKSVAEVNMFAKSHIEAKGPGVSDEPAGNTDPDAEFKGEYQKAVKDGIQMNVSEEEYVTSRRIDAGLQPLVTF